MLAPSSGLRSMLVSASDREGLREFRLKRPSRRTALTVSNQRETGRSTIRSITER